MTGISEYRLQTQDSVQDEHRFNNCLDKSKKITRQSPKQAEGSDQQTKSMTCTGKSKSKKQQESRRFNKKAQDERQVIYTQRRGQDN